MTFRNTLIATLALTAAATTASYANLVTNGGFEQTTFTTNSQIGGNYGQGVTGWTGNGFNLFFFGNALTQSAANQYNDPGNRLNANVPNSPDGGNLIAMDGDTGIHGALSQTLTGLTVGTNYAITFDWAAAQLANRTGDTTEQMAVSFGDATQLTQRVSNPSQGFTGWFVQTFLFRATSTSQVLSFLSDGTPNGYPPVALLDGVSATDAPEPSGLGMFGLGAAAIGCLAAFRRRLV